MFKCSKDGISVLTILDARRAKKSGQFPIKVQVVYRRKQRYYSIGREVSEEDWARLLKVKSRLLAGIRSDIESSFSTIKQQVNELITRGEFGIETLSVRLGRQMNDATLRSAFHLKAKGLEAYEQADTYLNRQGALKNLGDFRGSTIPLENITIDWPKRCERFWISEGKNYSSISIYFQALKCVLSHAVHDGIIKESSFPFGRSKYEIPEGCGRKLVLTLSGIKKVISYQCEAKDIEEFRDLQMFSYLCNGINFMDLLFLQYSSIMSGGICFVRSEAPQATKHNKEIHAIITPEMWNIIQRRGNPRLSPQMYIFKYARGTEDAFKEIRLVRRIITRCDRRLKRIAQDVGAFQLTTYTARYSFAIVLERGSAKSSYTSGSLGHSNLSVTERYLTHSKKEERIRNTQLLANFNLQINTFAHELHVQ